MTSPVLRYGPETDLTVCARLIHFAFGSPLAGAEEWLRTVDPHMVRSLRVEGAQGSEIVACLRRIDMGQYFGGRSVPMFGVAGVATSPEFRGQGHARRMMEEFLRECRREGAAISTLFASTQTLYRQVGYELAGNRFVTRVRFSDLKPDSREVSMDSANGTRALRVVPLGPADEADVRSCYADFARRYDGMLDRGEYVWKRTRQMRDQTFEGFGLRDAAGVLEGYVFFTQARNPSGRHDLHLSDFAFRTGRAARRLAALLGDFGTMMEECQMFGAPQHPLAQCFEQQRYQVEKKDFWMVRITDVARAIASRGVAPGLAAAFELDIRDAVIPENEGCWSVRISEGSAMVQRLPRAGPQAIRMDIRALGALYCGMATFTQAAAHGWVEGPEDALARIDGVFARSTPWMTDHF